MFSSTSRLVIRAQCLRCFSSILSSMQKPQSLILKSNSTKYVNSSPRFFNTDKFNPLQEVDPEDAAKEAAKKYRRKTPEIPKITLLDTNNSMSVCTFEEAEKIAEGRKLRLVNVVDTELRSQRPIYKLMTEAQFLEEEVKEKRKKKSKGGDALKGEKIQVLSTRITEYDLEMKLKKTEKWIEKNYEVRVTISGVKSGSEAELENVFKKFEERLEGKARILQKRIKGNDLKFQAMPLTEQLIASSQENREKKLKKGKLNGVVNNEKNDSDSEVASQKDILSKV